VSRSEGTHHHGPLAGLGAGAAAVLFAFGVLALAWHRVAAQVSTGITVLVYVVITAVCGLLVAALVYVFLWLRHRVRHPETLARQPVRAEVVGQAAPPVAAPERAAELPAGGTHTHYHFDSAEAVGAALQAMQEA